MNYCFFSGETALIHAARQGHTATAKYLIDHGADPTISSNLGATALHHSAGIGACSEFLSDYVLFCIEKKLPHNRNLSYNIARVQCILI